MLHVTYFDTKTSTVHIVAKKQVVVLGKFASDTEDFHKVILSNIFNFESVPLLRKVLIWYSHIAHEYRRPLRKGVQSAL